MDNGSTFTFTATELFTFTLDDTLYPLADFSYTLQGILGMVSHGSTVGPGGYPAKFEGVTPGSCTRLNRDFSVDIVIQ